MNKFLIKNNSDKLLIFFLGFGFDQEPFDCLEECEYDILYLYNYNNLDLEFDFSAYSKIDLIAWSWGVWAASNAKLPNLNKKIAIAGTPYAIDEKFGIHPRIIQKMRNALNEDVMEKFYKKMFNDNNEYEKFIENRPKRTIEDIMNEMDYIINSNLKENNLNFDNAILCQNDKIFPYKSQKEYFEDSTNIKELNSGHFPFYQWKNFSDIINL